MLVFSVSILQLVLAIFIINFICISVGDVVKRTVEVLAHLRTGETVLTAVALSGHSPKSNHPTFGRRGWFVHVILYYN